MMPLGTMDAMRVGILITVAVGAVACVALALVDQQALTVGAVFITLIFVARLSRVYRYADVAAALLGSLAYGILEGPRGTSGIGAWFVATICFVGAVIAIRFVEQTIEESEGRFRESQQMVDELTMYDDISGLLKRRYGDLALEEEVRRARRTRAPLSLVLVSGDEVPDHPVEAPPDDDHEAALIGSVFRDSLRLTDRMTRLSSTTFAAILPDTDVIGGSVVADKIHQMCEERGMRQMRCGVATFPNHAVSAEALLEEAMAALTLARSTDLSFVSPDMLAEETAQIAR